MTSSATAHWKATVTRHANDAEEPELLAKPGEPDEGDRQGEEEPVEEENRIERLAQPRPRQPPRERVGELQRAHEAEREPREQHEPGGRGAEPGSTAP